MPIEYYKRLYSESKGNFKVGVSNYNLKDLEIMIEQGFKPDKNPRTYYFNPSQVF